MERESLYETVAGRVEALIRRGAFRPGERIPSVRALSRQLEVSVTTVVEAYRLLEDHGVVEARPQSGYYVRPLPAAPAAAAARPARAAGPVAVTVGELVMRVLRDAQNPRLHQLGAAIPNPDLLPLKRVTQVMAAVARAQAAACSAYTPPPGALALRRQIARRALAAGCALDPGQVVITSGCQEAVVLSLRAVCRPGDTVAIESPAYYGSLQAIEMLGLRALEVPSDPREGIDLGALAAAIERHPVAACIATPNFSNPLGSRMPDEKIRALVRLLARHEIPLIEDDIVADLYHAGERPKAARAFDDAGLVLTCSSFSKTITPGFRVGWVTPGRFQAAVERAKMASNLATASLPQLAVAEFLRDGGYDHHLRRIRAVYARQATMMAESVERLFPPGTRVNRPTGGYVLWVELPAGVDAVRLYSRAVKAGITLAPGPIFAARPAFRNCVRLNSAFWSPAIDVALRTLGELADAMRDGPCGP